jgi:hypothetical protein
METRRYPEAIPLDSLRYTGKLKIFGLCVGELRRKQYLG